MTRMPGKVTGADVGAAETTPAAGSHPLCERYGFDAAARGERLALAGLDPADLGRAAVMQQRIAPHAGEIVDAFYEHLLAQADFRRIVEVGGFDVTRLRETFRLYVTKLGEGFDGADYFESRLRVGRAHARVGVPPAVYIGAYRALQELIIERLPADEVGRDRMIGLVLGLTALDMSLAIETYHNIEVEALERSIAEHRDAEQRLRVTAITDALTGLPNRARILFELAEALDESDASGAPVSVVMADLDRFKRVNDRHGHLVGDDMLREVAARMKGALRGSDSVGRYGGEEFLIVLRGTAGDVALEIGERVRRRVADQPFHIGGLRLAITLSQGVAERGRGEEAERLLSRADDALYRAKRLGRDRVEAADGCAGEEVRDR